MKPLKTAAVLAVAALQFPAFAGGPSGAPTSTKIWIDGTSTVRPFTCSVVKSDVAVNPGPDAAELLRAEPVPRPGSVRIAVRDIDCKDGVMNEHMQNALQAKAYPEIRFELEQFTAAQVQAAETPLSLKGTLTIAGSTKGVTIAAVARKLADGGLKVQGRYPVKMSQYRVTPPSLFFGAIKVDDGVTVGFELTFAAAQAQGLREGPVGRKDCAPKAAFSLEQRLARFWEEGSTAGLPSSPNRKLVAVGNERNEES